MSDERAVCITRQWQIFSHAWLCGEAGEACVLLLDAHMRQRRTASVAGEVE